MYVLHYVYVCYESHFKAVTEANKRLQLSKIKININRDQNEYNQEENGYEESRRVAPIVKLVFLNVPVFLGVYTKWASFYDTALIHNNDILFVIKKLTQEKINFLGNWLLWLISLEKSKR